MEELKADYLVSVPVFPSAFSPRVEAEEKCKFSTGQLPPGPPPCLRATSSADQARGSLSSPEEEAEEDGAEKDKRGLKRGLFRGELVKKEKEKDPSVLRK